MVTVDGLGSAHWVLIQYARLSVPGDLDSAVETIVGENVYTDPVTHRKVLRSTGRSVFGPEGELSRAGQQPFLDAFTDGDMSVFDAVCAALATRR
jgi:hypothetical protein